jgi:hypothetical protein
VEAVPLNSRPEKGRVKRRQLTVHGYVGLNGMGKTLGMVWDTLPSLEAGRPVLSTVRLLDYENPRLCDDPTCESPNHGAHMAAHPLWVPFTKWSQLVEWSWGDVLMDEVSGVASSRASMSMPSIVENILQQLRRGDVSLRWSAPSWDRADTIIRSCSQAVTVSRGLMPVPAIDADGNERIWRHRRWFVWRTFDAREFTDFTDPEKSRRHAKQKLRPMCRDRHWGPGSPAFDAYDTFDQVLSLDSVSDAGRCLNCGGRRSAPACSCEGYDIGKRTRRRVPAAGPAERVATAHGDASGPQVIDLLELNGVARGADR